MKRKDTLCWGCARVGTSTCSWDKRLKPVEGWYAEAVAMRGSHEKGIVTWKVIECPLYLPDRGDKYEKESVKMSPKVTREQQEVMLALFRSDNLRISRTDNVAKTMGISQARVRYWKRKWIKEGKLNGLQTGIRDHQEEV